MNNQCEQFDLKTYALGETSVAGRKTIESHAASCDACRTELDSLDTLHAALRTWADEEPPRRIAFVSDKVFEPSLWQRWLSALNPATLLASAVLAGLVSFGMARLGSVPSVAVAQPSVSPAVSPVANASNDVDLKTQIDEAVKLALAETEVRHQQDLRATERRIRNENVQANAQTMAIMESNVKYMRKHEARIMRASADTVNFQ